MSNSMKILSFVNFELLNSTKKFLISEAPFRNINGLTMALYIPLIILNFEITIFKMLNLACFFI